jgi:predicted ester cyclase
MSEQNKAVVRRLIEDHWNAKNHALVSEFFAPAVAIHTPDGVLNGLDGASMLLQAYATAFPDFRLIIDDLVADADKVAFRWTFNGTHRGPLADIRATGKQVSGGCHSLVGLCQSLRACMPSSCFGERRVLLEVVTPARREPRESRYGRHCADDDLQIG